MIDSFLSDTDITHEEQTDFYQAVAKSGLKSKNPCRLGNGIDLGPVHTN